VAVHHQMYSTCVSNKTNSDNVLVILYYDTSGGNRSLMKWSTTMFSMLHDRKCLCLASAHMA